MPEFRDSHERPAIERSLVSIGMPAPAVPSRDFRDSVRRITLVSTLSANDALSPDGIGDSAPPLGILALAAALRPQWDVEVVDLDHIWRYSGNNMQRLRESAAGAVLASRPDVVGFSCSCGTFPTTIRLAETCAGEIKGVPIVLGGPQASVVDLHVLEAFPWVDYVVRGEADESLPALLRQIKRGGDPGSVDGVSWRSGGQARRNAAAAPVDLDRLPIPAYDLIPEIDRIGSFPVEAGRGCPFSCTFCSTNDFFRRRFRLKSAARILEEMRFLETAYGVTIFDLVHDMFTVDRRKVVEFCQLLIDNEAPYDWSCSARTDCVDSDLLRLMRRAGCIDVFFGIETGSQRMQQIIDKGLDLEVSRQVLREANEIGMLTTASLITGYPEETFDDFRDTVRFFCDVTGLPNVQPQLHILSPLAETPLTTKNFEQLVLGENWTETSENGLVQDAEDQALIRNHKNIFPNFYGFTCPAADLSYLRRVRDFLFFATARCAGLLQALYQQSDDILSVFGRWEEYAGTQSSFWYAGKEFALRLVDFAEQTFDSDTAIGVMARFHRVLLASDSGPEVSVRGSEWPAVALKSGVRIVTCQGDVQAVYRALRNRVRPDPDASGRIVTLVVRARRHNHSEIFEFPALSLEILRFAEKRTAIEYIVAHLEQAGVRLGGFDARTIVAGAIELFKKKGLIARIGPESPAATGRRARTAASRAGQASCA